jgi:hypothetical protein
MSGKGGDPHVAKDGHPAGEGAFAKQREAVVAARQTE